MKVSIIVIAYNEEHHIAHCIQSILKQDYKNFMLIIVNDGSTDNSEQVVRHFNDSRMVHLKHRMNKGCAFARNTGLKAAKGKYVFFTDADCVVKDGWIRNGVNFMEAHPEIAAASGICLIGKHKSFRDKPWFIKGTLARRVYEYPHTMNGVYRSNVIKSLGGFNERYNISGEDADLSFRIMKKWKTGVINNMVVVHQPKRLSVARGLFLIRRRIHHVYLLKDHGKDFPKLRNSLFCYRFLLSPHYLIALFFPPFLLYLMFKNRSPGTVISFRDILFLIPLYIGLWYGRILYWRTAFREKIFLL